MRKGPCLPCCYGVLLPPEDRPELPVVILEVQMFPDALFFHRLIAGGRAEAHQPAAAGPAAGTHGHGGYDSLGTIAPSLIGGDHDLRWSATG